MIDCGFDWFCLLFCYLLGACVLFLGFMFAVGLWLRILLRFVVVVVYLIGGLVLDDLFVTLDVFAGLLLLLAFVC